MSSHCLWKVIPCLPGPEALQWVGRELLSWPSLPPHVSILIRNMDDVEYTLILVHTGLGLQGRALQKISRATCSVLQPWFQPFLSPPLRCPCATSMAVHHPQTRTPAFPAASWHLPVEQCRRLLQVKKSLLCLTPDWFNLTRYLFCNKYFSTLDPA